MITRMWTFALIALNTVSSASLSPDFTRGLVPEQIRQTDLHRYPVSLENSKIAQTVGLLDAASPSGYSLKHSSDWQRVSSPNSDPNFDIFIAKNFSNPQGGFWVTITTTVVRYMGVPKKVPEDVNKVGISAAAYARNLAETGYKIHEKTDLMINERRAVRLVTETPNEKGSVMVFIEGEGEQMIVSTSVYPLDSSIVSQEVLDQVVDEVDSIQNSIAIR